MHLVRDDLDEEDLAALERQFPGLTARVRAMRAPVGQVTDGADHGVHQLHPAGGPVDNPASEVQQLHPAGATGCNHRTNGVQLLRERGAAVAPEPSFEPPTEPPAARADARGSGAPAAGDRPEAGGGVSEFFARLGPGWLLTAGQRRRLAPAVAGALSAGWAPAALAKFVGANTAGVRSPAAVLAARLSPAELPAPLGGAPARPPWCGACDELTRMLGRYDGETPSRCPRCHPLRFDSTSGPEAPSDPARERSEPSHSDAEVSPGVARRGALLRLVAHREDQPSDGGSGPRVAR